MMTLEQQIQAKEGHIIKADLERMAVAVKLCDLDALANIILEIDESKGNRNALQVFVNQAHRQIINMLGEYAYLVYEDDDLVH